MRSSIVRAGREGLSHYARFPEAWLPITAQAGVRRETAVVAAVFGGQLLPLTGGTMAVPFLWRSVIVSLVPLRQVRGRIAHQPTSRRRPSTLPAAPRG